MCWCGLLEAWWSWQVGKLNFVPQWETPFLYLYFDVTQGWSHLTNMSLVWQFGRKVWNWEHQFPCFLHHARPMVTKNRTKPQRQTISVPMGWRQGVTRNSGPSWFWSVVTCIEISQPKDKTCSYLKVSDFGPVRISYESWPPETGAWWYRFPVFNPVSGSAPEQNNDLIISTLESGYLAKGSTLL